MEKTTCFNLIILDESGSMSHCVRSTISGCNETLAIVRNLQKEHAERTNHFVSIYPFQGSGSRPSRYLMKNEPIANVQDITGEDYEPCGMTPLLDAVGSTLVDLEAVAKTHADSTAIVTIITDGYENASTRYTGAMVSEIIGRLKEKGWTFNLIGANIDLDMLGTQLNIDNRMAFCNTDDGAKEMFCDFNKSMQRHERRRCIGEDAILKECASMSEAERKEKISHYRKSSASRFFNDYDI